MSLARSLVKSPSFSLCFVDEPFFAIYMFHGTKSETSRVYMEIDFSTIT
jgi:hypothetical protein